MIRTMHKTVAAIPIASVKMDKWLTTPAQMKSNVAAYIGCRMYRYGPLVMIEGPLGTAVTRNVPFGKEIRAQTFNTTAAT